MAKQWAGRIVLSVQFICWFAVSCLLLQRGLNNIRQKKENQVSVPSGFNLTANSTLEEESGFVYQDGRGLFAGVVMISVATLMLVISVLFVVVKLLENKRRRNHAKKTDQSDLPPKYEDIVESAPKYSSLFQFSECGEALLDDGKTKTHCVIVKPEQVPLAPGSSSA